MASRRQIRPRKAKPESLLAAASASAAAPSIQRPSFPVVAIGASAGGLDAYSEFFRALPSDTGMAFVLVQHLDPQHHSMLSGILSKTTKMPVEEVKPDVEIRPDRVYVIPPNAFIAITKGRFVLTPRQSERGQHLAVDFFMRSLAEDRQSGAIGIILSGTGSDGALGVEAIKAEAGLNFAQDPATAKYDGMPLSAIASGCVDFVLPPREIAHELDRIRRHPYAKQITDIKAEEAPPAAKDAFEQIIHLLRKSGGVDFGLYKPNTIHRRALRRMAILKYESLAEYAKHLKDHPEEVGDLYDDILINVTSFFRDPEAFEVLKTRVYPAILKDKGDNRSIRMWVPGCSTGEEAYSLAITLLEFLGDRAADFQVQLFGTDLNEKGIQKARAGVYSERIANEVSPERLRRFFVKTDEGYRVAKTIRDMCVFARQNVVNDPPFSQMDLVACRNMLIYMGPALQKKVLPILHYALRPTGFLFLGSSESVSGFPALFSSADKKYKIYAKNPIASRLHYDFSHSHYPVESGVARSSQWAEIQGGAPHELDVQAEADRLVLRNYAPVGVVINGAMEVVQFRGRTAPYLEPAPGKPTLNVLKLARHALARELHSLIDAAKKKGLPISKSNVLFEDDGQKRIVNISVAPLDGEGGASPDERFFLILFEEANAPRTAEPESFRKGARPSTEKGRELKRLKQELAAAQEALHASIESEEATREEFQSANEEILSAYEELQSTNEELETSKEELQSTNEELNTLNEELRHRNVELNELSNDISNLLNSAKLPVVMLDRDLRIRRFTPTAEKMLKVAPTDIGRPISDLKLKVGVPDLEQMISNVLESFQPAEREVANDQAHWYSLQIHPYRTLDNKIDGVVLALMDIDVIKKSQAQLKKSSAFLRGIVDTVREPLLVLDPDLRVVAANTPFLRVLNLPAEATVNTFLYSLNDGIWNIPDLRSALDEVLKTKSEITGFQVEREFPRIGRRTMLINARVLIQADDEPPMILVAMEDITERKLAETALIRSEKLAVAGRMASSLAHEINNPLQGMMNLLTILSGSAGMSEQDRLHLSEANKLLSRIDYLTKQSLSFYRDSSSPIKMNVAEVLDSVLEFHSELIRKNDITIRKRYSVEGPVLAFPNEIQQVFATLFVNAIDSVDGHGVIAIRASRAPNRKGTRSNGLRITVADNGSGMPAAIRQRIFDPFFTTKGEQGVGLGLWITNAIVQRLGGTIRVRSKPQSGTCFSVFLPDQAKQSG